jgi:hypothetical protein
MLYAVHCNVTQNILGYIDTSLLVAAQVDRHEHDNAEWGIELIEVEPRNVDANEFPSRVDSVEDFAAWMRPGAGA